VTSQLCAALEFDENSKAVVVNNPILGFGNKLLESCGKN